MNPSLTLDDTQLHRRNRGRLQLILILAVVFGPMILATSMYKLNFWVPQSRSYHGELIANGKTPADLGVRQDQASERWQLLVTAPAACAADCQQLVYLARQINIGLNRDANRAEHVLAAAQPLPAEFQAQLDKDYPRLKRFALDTGAQDASLQQGTAPQLWIVDPHGNLVLRYPAGSNGKAILGDMLQLLKLSHIG